MKTILLLGGYGFLGTNVMKYVDTHLADQYRFIVFDKMDHHMGGVTFTNIVKTYAGDFSDSMLLKRVFRENQIDIIIHSLSTTVPVDSANARYDVESNLLPTLDVLALMVEYHVYNIVYLSSGGAIYGTKGNNSHCEDDDVSPISSYGVVKLAIEKYLLQYAQLYGIQPLILRLSNPYGPYHYSMKQGVINVAMALALRHQPMQIWGAGTGHKDYIYVEDYAKILFILLDKGIHNEVINIASGQLLSVNDIVAEVCQCVPDFVADHVAAKQFDAEHFELDTTKLKKLIGEYAFTPLDKGIRLTYNWTQSLC